MHNKKVHIGTSGWSYEGWRGIFYPQGLKSKDYLSYYTGQFATVELNNSFYRLPSENSIQHWVDITPADFVFSCKASSYITHRKKLHEAHKGVEAFFDRLEHFGDKLGPVLFQLPPRWHVNVERLEGFFKLLPRKYHYAFEFRDTTWLCQDVYDVLKENNAILCFYDFKGYTSPEMVTSDWVYIRLHGPLTDAYQGSYDGQTLAEYAQKIKGWEAEGKTVFCYFDNDQKACAPKNAKELAVCLERLS